LDYGLQDKAHAAASLAADHDIGSAIGSPLPRKARGRRLVNDLHFGADTRRHPRRDRGSRQERRNRKEPTSPVADSPL
jgi:hypothetical protein